MKPLKDYILESQIFEFKNDLLPQTIIVIGGPGAGKTYWMENEAKLFFKRNNSDYKRLDSDHNLTVEQRKNCKRVAFEIMDKCRLDSMSQFRTQGETFKNLIKELQKEFDEKSNKNKIPLTKLNLIKFNWCKPWLKRFSLATEDNKQDIYNKFEKAFIDEYFDLVFASDFSNRHISKVAYSKDMFKKLHNIKDIDGVKTLINNDTIVAITGDKIFKIDKIISLANGTSVVIVYLNIPEEISIAQDAKRNRSIGGEMIHNKLQNIHETWNELIDTFETRGIFRMYELVPTEQSLAAASIKGWTINKQYINKNMIG